MLQRHPAVVVAVIGLLPFFLAACSDATSSNDPRMQAPLVRIATVEASPQSERLFTGIVAARVQSDLGFRIPGKVLERVVDAGQAVKRGQTLMRIDPTDLQLAVRGARAGPREAIIELPETLRPAIGSTGRATLYGSGLTGPAKLRQLSDAANRLTRTFEARYVLEGRLADAPLGSTISIQISNGRTAPALQVPVGAIFDPGKGPGVWLVEDETPRVTWRAVRIAGLSSEAASVVGNLKAGDRVVALGAHLLREGEHVRLAQGETARSPTVNGARQ